MFSSAAIIYEQPLNEHMRLCLRLESLFNKAKHYLDNDSPFSSRIALETILEILMLTDRPDLKTKLSKVLNLYATHLTQLLNKNSQIININKKKLHHVLKKLHWLTESLHSNLSKIGQTLRENDFLTTIQQRSTAPGGSSNFNIPEYHLWLSQPYSKRLQNLSSWLNHFAELKTIISLLLKLTRKSVDLESTKTENGFFQINLDPKITYQMVRIALPTKEGIHPEISAGRHRLSIHFYLLNTEGRSIQTQKKLSFSLALCKI